jgi:hypothetical protein
MKQYMVKIRKTTSTITFNTLIIQGWSVVDKIQISFLRASMPPGSTDAIVNVPLVVVD